jgi:hypothetical protein
VKGDVAEDIAATQCQCDTFELEQGGHDHTMDSLVRRKSEPRTRMEDDTMD